MKIMKLMKYKLDHLICNYFPRKVQKSGSTNLVREIWFEKSCSRIMVLQTWISFSGSRKVVDQKKVGLYYKSTFFSGWRKVVLKTWILFSGSPARKKIRVCKTTFLEPFFQKSGCRLNGPMYNFEPVIVVVIVLQGYS